MNKIKVAIVILYIFLYQLLFASQLHVPIIDPIYLYLDKMATSGLLPGYLNDTKPLNRDRIAKLLVELNNYRVELSAVDMQILDEYIADYRFELGNLKHFRLVEPDQKVYFALSSIKNIKEGIKDIFIYPPKQEDQHILVYETDNEFVWIDWDEMVRYEMKNDIGRIITQDAIRFSSQIGKNFCVYFDGYRYLQLQREGFNEPADEFKGGLFPTHDEGVKFYSFDYSSAYLQLTSKIGCFEIGIEPLHWGNSENSMILSSNAAPFPFISWRKKFHRSIFTFFHGSLMPSEFERDSVTNEKIYAQKYIAAHRWEVELSKKLHFAFSELYFYGNRNPELVYLVPTVVLWPTQHNLNDRDNATMALELEYFPFKGWKIYGTLFLDELRPSELFSQWWGNKHGVQAGIHFVPNIKTISTDFRAEFTAIRPWTYTHEYYYNSYTHNGVDLGFYGGPNSQLISLENRLWLTKKQTFFIKCYQFKHGQDFDDPSNENYFPVGGDSNQNYNERNHKYDNSTKWLMGNVTTIRALDLKWCYQWRNEICFEISYRKQWVDSKANDFISFQIHLDY